MEKVPVSGPAFTCIVLTPETPVTEALEVPELTKKAPELTGVMDQVTGRFADASFRFAVRVISSFGQATDLDVLTELQAGCCADAICTNPSTKKSNITVLLMLLRGFLKILAVNG